MCDPPEIWYSVHLDRVDAEKVLAESDKCLWVDFPNRLMGRRNRDGVRCDKECSYHKIVRTFEEARELIRLNLEARLRRAKGDIENAHRVIEITTAKLEKLGELQAPEYVDRSFTPAPITREML